MAFAMIRALVFDFDGLILDTETPLLISWREIYEETGLTFDEQWWGAIVGASADPPEPYEALEEHFGHPIDRNRIWERHNTREREILATQDTLPGVRKMLREAQRCRLGVAIASSSERKWVVILLKEQRLLSVFDAIVCMDDVARTKPAPDLYIEALHRLEVRPPEAIAFEDSAHGVAAAVAAGLFCVAVPNNVTQYLDFSHADLVLGRIDEMPLREILDRAASRRT